MSILSDRLPVVRDDDLLTQATADIPTKQGRTFCPERMPVTPFLCSRELDHDDAHVARDADGRAWAAWPVFGHVLMRSVNG